MAGILKFALGLDLADFSGNAKKAEEFLEHLTKSAKGSGSPFGDLAEKILTVGKSVKGIASGTALGGLAGIAGAFGAALTAVEAMRGVFFTMEGIARSIEQHFAQAVERGAQLYYLSARTQTGVSQLYSLRYSATQVGLSEDAPQNLLLKLQRALSGVSEEGQRTDQTFAILGLNMRELRTLAPDQQLNAVAQALHNVNAAQRAGLASNIFGRFGYGDILQITNQFDQWQRAMDEADPGGRLILNTAQAFSQTRASWTGLKADMEVFFTGIAANITIPLRDTADALRSLPLREMGETLGFALRPLAELIDLADNMAEFANNPGRFYQKKSDEVKSMLSDINAQPEEDRNKALWRDSAKLLLNTIGIPFASYGQTKGQGVPDLGPAPFLAPRTNPFEKMGFIFGGRSDAATDYARRTALATEQMVGILSRRPSDNNLVIHLRNAP